MSIRPLGSVSSGNNLTFVIDRHKFAVTAGDDTVASLRRFAVASQLERRPGASELGEVTPTPSDPPADN